MKSKLKSMVPVGMFISGISFVIAAIVIVSIYFNNMAPFYDQRDTPTNYYKAEIVDVYSGDTLLADLDLGFGMKLYSVSLVLDDIAAPKLTEPLGDMSKNYLTEQVKGQEVIIKTDEEDPYGRWLVELYEDGRNMNDIMVEKGYANPLP